MNPEEITLDYLKECYYYCTSPVMFEQYVNIVSEYMVYQIEHLYPMSADEYRQYAESCIGYVFSNDSIDMEKVHSIQRVPIEFTGERLKECGFNADEVYMIMGSIHEQARINLDNPLSSPLRKTFKVLVFNSESIKLNWVWGMFFASFMYYRRNTA